MDLNNTQQLPTNETSYSEIKDQSNEKNIRKKKTKNKEINERGR